MNGPQATLGLVAALAIFAAPVAASAETVSGQVVDLGTYVTRDHNMDAMHGSMSGKHSMGNDSMPGHEAMGGRDAMSHPCPSTLGLVKKDGAGLYLLVTQMGSTTGQTLCKRVGRNVTLDGTAYNKNGMNAFLVRTAK